MKTFVEGNVVADKTWVRADEPRAFPWRWSQSAWLTRTRLPQAISLIPLLGYAVLYGDQVQGMLMKFTSLGGGLWFTPLQRIHIIYVGGLIVLAGVLIFWARCPSSIRSFPDRRTYGRAIVEGAEPEELRKVFANLRPYFSEDSWDNGNNLNGPFLGIFPDGELRSAVGLMRNADHMNSTIRMASRREAALLAVVANYELLDRSRPVSSLACLSFLLLGGALFLLPSLEVMLMALQRLTSVF